MLYRRWRAHAASEFGERSGPKRVRVQGESEGAREREREWAGRVPESRERARKIVTGVTRVFRYGQASEKEGKEIALIPRRFHAWPRQEGVYKSTLRVEGNGDVPSPMAKWKRRLKEGSIESGSKTRPQNRRDV